jgi:hypothetical protein
VQRRSVAYVLLGVVVVIGVGLIVDAVVVTEEERLEVFLDSVTGEVTSEKIASALAWVDTSRQPVEVSVRGQSNLYEDDESLQERARDSMRRFIGQDLRILGESIVVEDDRATIHIRVINSQLGMVNVDFDLRKRGEDWLVAKVGVTR